VIKSRGNQVGRTVLTKMLECIPVGMHDSFMKPHDYVDDVEVRPRGAPRLYKYYLTIDIDSIIAEYDALTPPAYVEDPTQTAAERQLPRPLIKRLWTVSKRDVPHSLTPKRLIMISIWSKFGRSKLESG